MVADPSGEKRSGRAACRRRRRASAVAREEGGGGVCGRFHRKVPVFLRNCTKVLRFVNSWTAGSIIGFEKSVFAKASSTRLLAVGSSVDGVDRGTVAYCSFATVSYSSRIAERP